ncbi:MAG: PEP-CTERM sorting domain-containing protein [Planctomycetota bacterium]
MKFIIKTISYRRRAFTLAAAIGTLLAMAGHATTPDPLWIMPVGDSITAGYTDNPTWNEPYQYGYRSTLYNLLVGGGYNPQFVGSSGELLDHETISPGTTPPADLHALGQNAHHGFGGSAATDLQGGITTALNTHTPDVVLLKIGTNAQNTTALDTLVDTITTTSPSAHLIIAEIMPKWTYQQGIVDYNTYIRETLVPTYQGLGRNISTVDQYTNFLTDTGDLTTIDQARISNMENHPDNVGYDRMAQTWFGGIEAIDFSATPPPPVTTVIQAKISSTTQLAFSGDVSSSDLLHGLTPTTSGWNTVNEASPLELNDGIHGAAFNVVPGDRVQGAWTTVLASAEYDLGTGNAGHGFDLTAIVSIADWNSAGFGNQGWTIEVKGVGETAYELLAVVDHQPLNALDAGTTKVTLTDESGVLASGVQFVRITANHVNGGANGGAFIWRELDVFGVSTVPEPGMALLLGFGGLFVLRRRCL